MSRPPLALLLAALLLCACETDAPPRPDGESAACPAAVWVRIVNATPEERAIRLTGSVATPEGATVATWEPKPVTLGGGFRVSVRDVLSAPLGHRVSLTATVANAGGEPSYVRYSVTATACRIECTATARGAPAPYGVTLDCEQR